MINSTIEKERLQKDIERLAAGRHHDPFEVLGIHQVGKTWEIRVWLPTAESANIEGKIPLGRLEGTDLFIGQVTDKQKATLPQHFKVVWTEADGSEHSMVSPYTFLPLLGELDLHLFAEGRHWEVFRVLGAHKVTVDGIDGVRFAVWAPAAERVSVIGDFNGWNGLRHPMRVRGRSGVWELFIPGLWQGDLYKYEIRNAQTGHCHVKTDPYGQWMEKRPATSNIVFDSDYTWQDDVWMQARTQFDWQGQPINIYEVHLGSWQQSEEGEFLNYRELAHRLVEYVKWMGYTHIELMPVSEHPLDQS